METLNLMSTKSMIQSVTLLSSTVQLRVSFTSNAHHKFATRGLKLEIEKDNKI